MASYEDSYKSQLQGVSQQVPRDRKDGQLTEQINMRSDPVTNLRRRPGCRMVFSQPMPTSNLRLVRGWDVVIGSTPYSLYVNGQTGYVLLMNVDNTVRYSGTDPYLITDDMSTIYVNSLADKVYLCNTKQKPVIAGRTTYTYAGHEGFFEVRAGAFSKTYYITVTDGAITHTYSYTTPDASAAGAAAQSTPEYIAAQLGASIAGGPDSFMTFVSGRTVAVRRVNPSTTEKLTVRTNIGASFLNASGRMTLRSESDLPADMPAQADGWIVQIGEDQAGRYYKWDDANAQWLETGALGSATLLTNMPSTVWELTGGTINYQAGLFGGRTAGNDTNNPDPEFTNSVIGITGMTVYQGRLVLFAGNLVYLSSTTDAAVFYRVTTASLLDSDAIGIGSSNTPTAQWRYGVQFQRDLLLFSENEQGFVPGSQSAITPRTATVLPSTQYTSDMGATPIVAGKTVLAPIPRGASSFGVMEVAPSAITEGQYTGDDVTAHLTSYMVGRCRRATSSSIANTCAFLSSANLNHVYIHEYFWNGNEKIQQAWHRWEFPYPVVDMFFAGGEINLVFVQNGLMIGCAIDPHQFTDSPTGQRYPFMDMSSFSTITDHIVAYPSWLRTFDPSSVDKVSLSAADGDLAGEPVGFDVVTIAGIKQLQTVLSWPSGNVAVGIPYESSFIVTPPMLKDSNGVKISTNKMTVTRFLAGTVNSGEYNVEVSDAYTDDPDALVEDPMAWSSPELELGEPIVAADATVIIPARTRAESTRLRFFTSGMRELNLVGLEFTAKSHQRVRRAQH